MECIMTRNPQALLDFASIRPASAVVEKKDPFTASMRALEDAYDAIGNLVCAGATGIGKSDLPKMFEAGSDRHMRFKAVFQIGELASAESRHAILLPLAQHFGFGLCSQLTDKERADRLQAFILTRYPEGIGDLMLVKALGGPCVSLTDKERADKLEAYVSALPGDRLVEEALR
jgi:hypothetical protein